MANRPLPISGSLFLTADLAWLEEAAVRAKIQECCDCGMRILVPTLAAAHGRSYVPSRVLPVARTDTFAYRWKRTRQPVDVDTGKRGYDLFKVIAEECERLGMKFFIPSGSLSPEKPGSLLMWPVPATEWFTPEIAQVNRRFIQELAERYATSTAFAGWYISDEMKWSIEEHTLLVKPLAEFCRTLTPKGRILMSPSPAHTGEKNRRLTDPKQVAELGADIVCPMDGGTYTHQGPAMWSDEMFEDVRRSHEETSRACHEAGVTYWVNVEMFFYDHERIKNVPFSASWERVKRQIETASPYAERLLGFQYFALVDAPDSAVPLGAEGAVELYKGIFAHNEAATTGNRR